jgi:hypothetical protein
VHDETEYRIEWAEDVEWDEDVAGWRPFDTVGYLDGEEISRVRCPEPAYYNPDSVPGSATSEKTQAEIDEVTFSRATSTGKMVVTAGFSSSGKAHVSDVEVRDGKPELVPVGTVPITPSPPPKIPERPMPAMPSAPTSSMGRTFTRPRERRPRRVSGGTRASPGDSEPPLDLPGVAGLFARVRDFLAGWRRSA